MTNAGTFGCRAAAIVAALLFGTVIAAAPAGCAPSVRIGEEAPAADAGPPAFTEGDASLDAAVTTTTSYCPSNKCPAPLLTCPTSRFLCDVDPTTDVNNCGGCSSACPPSDHATTFACVDGACAMKCVADPNGLSYGNCDGLADNGCETQLGTTDNCGACGNECADGVPCIKGQCGCPAPLQNCGGVCVDLMSDDANCGGCGDACENLDDVLPNAYRGCVQGHCDQLKCRAEKPFYQYVDCNGDLTADPSDGCEVDILQQPNDEHCGACGVRCTGGTHCVLNGGFQCGCPAGMRDCGSGACVNISTDVDNCGSCNRACKIVGDDSSLHATDTCTMGECGILCTEGYADCNDNPDDGCEVDLRADPRHCGACDVACDGVAGQACVGGHCIVEECGGVH